MFFIQTVRQLSRAIRNASTLEKLLSMHGGGGTLAGENVTHETAMRCAAVWACVSLIAKSSAGLPLPIYRRTENDGKERDKTHPLHRVFNFRANPLQDAVSFRTTIGVHLALTGNFLGIITRDRLAGGVVSIDPILPSALIEPPTRKANGRLTYKIAGADGRLREFDESQIFHVRAMSDDGVMGIDPITAYGNVVGLSQASLKHQSKVYANGAKFNGVLTSDQKLSDQARANLKEDFKNLYSGDNAWRTPLLEGGVKWQGVSMDSKQLEIMDTRRLSRQEIASIFCVPPHMIGDLSGQGYSSVEHQSINFVTYGLQPWLRSIEMAIVTQLIPPEQQDEYFAEHMVEGLLRGDTAARFNAYSSALQNGWMNRNEVRRRENLDPVEGLDEYLIPMHMGSGQQPSEPAN